MQEKVKIGALRSPDRNIMSNYIVYVTSFTFEIFMIP